MIPIVLSFSRVLARIATNLDRNPSLLQQASQVSLEVDELGGSKVSFVETTANVLRDAFIKCLAGSPGSSRTSKPAPDDKRYGIYLTANSCLKLLFQCRKIRNAQQMFTSIDAQSPPLSFYPAAQRVTYLYYLGRYHFANSHFYRAQVALQAAYDQCHREARKHRRLILIYLIASNICLGRFPSAQLFGLPEAQDLKAHFVPLCQIVRAGDLAALDDFFTIDAGNTHALWFLRKRILLQLQSKCEVLAWRSLVRRVFIIVGYKGEDKKIPFLRLPHVRAAAKWTMSRRRKGQSANGSNVLLGFGFSRSNDTEGGYVDADFAEVDQSISETGYDPETGSYNDDQINQPGSSRSTQQASEESPSIDEIESIFLSLTQQGFLRGFVLHTVNNPRFAIPGSQAGGGPVTRGFPNIWQVVASKNGSTVPGWVTDDIFAGGGSALRAGGALGGVVRLSGARPVGVGS